MDTERRHHELQRLADRQWAVLTIGQIRGLAFTDTEVQGLLQRAILHRRFKGVYTYATSRPPWKGVLLAAQWSCGEDAYLTGRTALGLANVRRVYLGRIDIVVPRHTARARRAPVHLRRTSISPERLRRDGPLRYAPVPRALLDLSAEGASVSELRGLITEAIHLSRFDHPETRRLLEDHAGERGVARLRESYGAYLPRRSSKSGLERSFDTGLDTRPHIPAPEPNVYIEAAHVMWEIDRYWANEKVAVELQGGGYHDAAEDRQKDEFKAAKLALIGIQILYISDIRWELEPEDCLDDLEGVLARRGWQRAG